MDYSITAKEILKAVGAEKNVTSLSHCITRLRFTLQDTSKINNKEIEKIPGVMGVINKGGQLQIIIGNNVAKCYAELQQIASFSESGGTVASRNPFVAALDFIAGCMTPILPVILAGGLVKVLIVLLGPSILGVLSETSNTYALLTIFGDAAFYFLPFLLAYTAARKLNTSIPLAMTLAGVLVHPDLIALLGAGEAVTFLKLPVYAGSYSSSVIPILLAVILLKYVERLVDKITPEWSKNFLKPLLILVITAPITLIALAPLGQVIGDGLAFVMSFVYNAFPPLALGIFGALMPLIVMTGMHYAFFPSTINSIATIGYDPTLLPGMFCSNLAQAAATLAVGIKTKKGDIKQVSISSAISAFLVGVTEPAMYGVTLKYKTPMIAACIGGGISGVMMGFFNTKVYAMAVPSLLSSISMIPTNDSATMMNFYLGLLCVIVSIVVSFVLTMILYKDPAEELEAEAPAPSNVITFTGSKNLTVANPIQGEFIPLDKVNDPTFSTFILGKGYAVVPSEGIVVAPFDGTVENMFETGHAIGLSSDDGVEMLIHIGLETVALAGKHFTKKVKTGDRVTKGQTLIEFDVAKIREAGYDITTPVIITNSDTFETVEPIVTDGTLDRLQAELALKS